MTGQVLSGTSPLIAVKYQIVVMYMITAAVMISSLLIVLQGYKKFFTRNHQFCEI
jgi:putative ABC transport system permease protein